MTIGLAACGSSLRGGSGEVALPPVQVNEAIPGLCDVLFEDGVLGQDRFIDEGSPFDADDALGLLDSQDIRYCVAPTGLAGSAVELGEVSLSSAGWSVNVLFSEGPDGIDQFNALAAECFQQSSICPSGQLAIALDQEILIAPSINAPTFGRDQIVISGGVAQPLEEIEARELAAVLGNPEASERVEFFYVLLVLGPEPVLGS